MKQPSSLLVIALSCLLSSVYAVAKPGEVVCRYTASTTDEINYYTCQRFSDRYGIDINKFFQLNSAVNKACDNLKINTEYCVSGYIQEVISTNGLCGLPNKNTTCIDTDKQCCNSETWKCGDTEYDCMAGTCFSGACTGFPDKYSLDGKCGYQNNNKLCTGKWGSCCNLQGQCGNGTSFCAADKCQSGNCDINYVLPWPSAGGSPVTNSPTSTPTPTPGTGIISPDGSCGGTNKYVCKGSPFGDCCSSSGFCGTSKAHCTAGCQKDFGTCTITDLSSDGTCGGANKFKCKGSGFGDCCSSSGFCGSTAGHCTAGCQPTFGTCSDTSISPDGSCGGLQGFNCKLSGFGNCCSSSGWCGVTAVHCGTACQAGFGDCFIPVGQPTTPTTDNVSKDGSCGSSAGLTCGGSGFGNCCSNGGYCGDTVNHCAQGCQKSFSSACLTSNVPTLDGSCGANNGKYTCANGPFNGQCCSPGGFCGTTDSHCKTGCQRDYGTCK
ncbi:hypothetical protein HBI67_137660 [Parastagonospora nodorum]|nr:hypothetical protein HBI66_197870 [Parastagonospora nodorum]KAH6063244.1 hypothetical protein HBI67_137660 [Parastagonospora nodorum]